MRITISHESDVPVREQLVAQLIFLIGSGQLKPGDPVPSVRELALRLKVHRNTVSQAYADPSLDALLERLPGRRLTVRPNQGTRSARPDLDGVINAAIVSAREHGYTLQQLRQRVQERLLVGPPDHLLLVEDEPGMAVVLRVELRQRFTCPVDVCPVQELETNRERVLGALVLSPPGLLPQVTPLVPADNPPIRIVYASADEYVERIRQLAHPSLIVVASVSRYFLEMARSVLAPMVGRRHSMDECLMVGDKQDIPSVADLIICDSVTYRLLRPKYKRSTLIHYLLISSACLDEIETTMANWRTIQRS